MPSKKKSHHRGKARKGANNKKVEEKKKEAETPDVQMQRLKIGGDDFQAADEDAALEEAIKVAAAEKEALDAANAENEKAITKFATNMIIRADQCHHGYVATEDDSIVEDFTHTFVATFLSLGAGANMGDAFLAANEAVQVFCAEVWYDSSKMKLAVSTFLFNGTQQFLDGDFNGARLFASIACYLEEYTAFILQTKATFAPTKSAELICADEHTLVKYLRQKIPCPCLDEKYKQVKSITKMGLCCNPHCSLPDRMVQRSKMMYCTRCSSLNYCSPACQKAHWPTHKKFCVTRT